MLMNTSIDLGNITATKPRERFRCVDGMYELSVQINFALAIGIVPWERKGGTSCGEDVVIEYFWRQETTLKQIK